MMCLALTVTAQDCVLTAIGASGQVSLTVSSASVIDFSNAGGKREFKITTNSVVKPKTGAAWASATISNGVVTVSVEPNTQSGVRQTSLVLAAPDGQSVTITLRQLGTEPGLLVQDDTLRVKGNNNCVVLNAVTNTENVTFSSADWITYKQTVAGNGKNRYVFATGSMSQGTRYGNLEIKIGSAVVGNVVVEQTFEGYPSFLLMSDIHFGASGAAARVEQSLKSLYENSGNVDALILNGDLTNAGNLSQYKEMLAVMTNYDIVPEYVERYFIMGNHEWYTSDGNGSMANYNSLGVDHNKYFDIKGYPFIYIGMSGGNEDDYSAESLNFLKESLDDAVLKYPSKPIFVFQHVPAYGTVQGSNSYDGGWGTKKVYEVLKNYPQVFDFSGHTHFSARCPLTFHQDAFTSLNDGGNLDCYVQAGIDVDGGRPEGTSTLAEGMIVTVDDETNLSVRRIDGARNEEIGEQLDFPAPYDGTNFTYANYKGSKPVFESSEITAEQLQPTQRKITFPQAVISEDDGNNVVLYYRVEILNDADSVVSTVNRCSRFYLGSDMPETLSVVADNINGNGMMRARVTAIDPYGNESDPIESDEFEQGEYKPAEDAKLPVADLFNLSVDDQGKGSDKSAMNNAVITSESTPIPFYDSDYKLTGAKFSQSTSQFYAVDYSNNDRIRTALTTGFTMEAFFSCMEVSGNQSPMSSQQGSGAGFWMDSGGKLHAYGGYGDGNWYDLVSTKNISPGKYYHAVLTYDGTKMNLYLNGYPAGEVATPEPLQLPVDGCHYLVAGGDVTSPGMTKCEVPLNGYLLISRLYSRAITRDEDYLLYKDAVKNYEVQAEDTTIAAEAPVADLFNIEFGENGTATDISEQQIAVNVGNTTPETYYNETYKRWVAMFPGNDSQCYFGVPYASNSTITDAMQGDLTLEALCMVNNDNLSSLPAVLSSQQSGGVGIEPGDVIQGWGYFSGSYATAYANDWPVQKNTWYHIVLVVQTLEVETPIMSIYVNGTFAGKTQLAGQMTLPQGSARYFCIGGDATYNGGSAEYLLNGEVAVARMYGHALTLPEIKRLYVDLTK